MILDESKEILDSEFTIDGYIGYAAIAKSKYGSYSVIIEIPFVNDFIATGFLKNNISGKTFIERRKCE
jgi:hypothetical protein